MHQVNDGKFPDNSPVEIRFPAPSSRSKATGPRGRGCQARF